MQRISVFGLGYVGAVSAACFAKEGNEVIGVDVNPLKVEMINAGRSPIIEENVELYIQETVRSRRLRATTNVDEAVLNSDISLICVGTPSNDNGSLKLDFVERVSREIGSAIGKKEGRHVVVVRSTMLPGTTDGVVIPALQAASGKRLESDFDVCVNPEFLREGTSIKDFYDPPFTLIGANSEKSAAAVKGLYENFAEPIRVTGIRAAEMVKYACNCFHGLKVTFANEIGNICKEMEIDSHEVMDIFCMDKKLNLSAYYLKPGFAFGGSCLPKDLRALQYKARSLDLKVPVLESVTDSNLLQIEHAIRMILKAGKKRIGFLGFAFKAGTDDLRESAVVSVVERLIGKGYDVRLYDREVSLAKLFGANKQYIESEIPHIGDLMVNTIEELLVHSEVMVIGNAAAEHAEILPRLNNGQILIDLVRIFGNRTSDENYRGLCW